MCLKRTLCYSFQPPNGGVHLRAAAATHLQRQTCLCAVPLRLPAAKPRRLQPMLCGLIVYVILLSMANMEQKKSANTQMSLLLTFFHQMTNLLRLVDTLG